MTSPPSQVPQGREYVAAAERIAARLCALARWDGPSCTWDVVVPDFADRGAPPRSRVEAAGGVLYQGTAGIALFLTELHAVAPDPEVRRTARAALRHAAAHGARLPAHAFGLHSGRVGIAHALVRYGRATGDDEALGEARALLAPLFGQEARDGGLDVIGGAAGAIPVLLQMAHGAGVPEARACAVALGHRIVRAARRWPEGWGWASGAGGNARDLAGLAHGAAGYGAALLELWAVTREPLFLHGAEQAFGYERHHYDAGSQNWPDYRSSSWGEILAAPERLAELRAQVLGGGEPPPPYRRTCMSAWCHGAPGIGLTRVRAYTLLNAERYAAEARAAVATTLHQLRTTQGNFSLCHGVAGNCELLIEAAAALQEPSWRHEAEGVVREAIARFDHPARRWPAGTLGGQPDPSLMLGEAGVGHFLLRLATRAVPSILLPVAPEAARAAGPPAASAADREACRALDAEAYFGRTLRAAEELGVGEALRREAAGRGDLPPVLAVAEALDAVVAGLPEERAALLADASLVERARYRATRELPDFTEQLIEELRRPSPDAVDWGTALVRLAPCARVVTTEREWDTWPGTPPADQVPPGGAAQYVVFRRKDHVEVRRLGAFAGAVLDYVGRADPGRGATVDDVVAHVLALAGQGGGAEPRVRERVTEQLRRSLAAGMITAARPGGGRETGSHGAVGPARACAAGPA